MGSFLVDRSQKRYNRPAEVCFLGLNNLTLVGRATNDLKMDQINVRSRIKDVIYRLII